MGNNSSKDSQHGGAGVSGRFQARSDEHENDPAAESAPSVSMYAQSNERRGSRHDIPFLHVGRDRNAEMPQRPKETRQEKEARRAERERQARLAERERSMREENVDGGFLVTLGTYTGPEDFSKPVVRQLQLERRLAPFWKGLNDHSDSWTEHQLVAAVRGLPIPAADDVPTEITPLPSQSTSFDASPAISGPYLRSDHPSSPVASPLSSSAPLASISTSPFFRGRSKTLASLTSGNKTPIDFTPQEIQLSSEPYVNGLPIEAYLYREPGECPICFLYYPPYLNKTRCCDQPICSECFVQIKRPDPHPPEHEQPGQQRRPEEEAELLVSEVAACPFCVAPEFGITYEPPPFRRGLGYANQLASASKAMSAASSQTSFQSGERRRAVSISASAPQVVTTDQVRPDWAKKLADARAHVLRRAAAATALHNAAYILGNQESLFRGAYGRRRRSVFIETPGTGQQTSGDGSNSSDLWPGRTSSRRNRVEDLEDLMMMEAIRLSLAAEEERKRKEEKEKSKEEKKKSKEAKKEAKQLEKLAKKNGGSSTSLYKTNSNDSTSTWATNSMARSTSNLGSPSAAIPEEVQGKGKAPVLTNRSRSGSAAASIGDAQRHLEESRSAIQPAASSPIPMPGVRHPRQLSNASSMASSLMESMPGSYQGESPNASGVNIHDGTPPVMTAGSLEPMLNFRSLAAMIDDEAKGQEIEHLEHPTGSLSQADGIQGQSPIDPAPVSVAPEDDKQQDNSGKTSASRTGDKVVAQHDQKAGPLVIEQAPVHIHEATQ